MATSITSTGQLNQRVQFQQRSAGEDTLGERDGAWVDLGTPVWAKVQPLAGRDYLAAGAMQQPVDTRITIRWRAGITASLRLLWKGQAYDISSVVPVDGRTDWIDIMCVSGVRDGR